MAIYQDVSNGHHCCTDIKKFIRVQINYLKVLVLFHVSKIEKVQFIFIS